MPHGEEGEWGWEADAGRQGSVQLTCIHVKLCPCAELKCVVVGWYLVTAHAPQLFRRVVPHTEVGGDPNSCAAAAL